MTFRTRTLCIVAAATVCLSVTAGAWAVSGRQISIARAFRYANDNPQQAVGSGVLGSNIYTGGSPGGGSQGIAPPPPGFAAMNTPISGALREKTPYVPLAPATLGAPSQTAALAASGGYSGNPIRDMASALENQQRQGPSYTGQWLASLAPSTPGAYRSAMLRGETDLRQGNYAQAINSFTTARELSKDSAESLLSLSHTYLAMGGESYGQAAEFLAKALKAFPDLAGVRVRPAEFFPEPNNFAACQAGLDAFVQKNPKDAGGLLLASYLQWRDGQVDQSLRTLDAAMAAKPSSIIMDGVAALLDGISRSTQLVLSAAPLLDQPVDYPWAGIRLAMPRGFTPSPLQSLSQVLVGTATDPASNESYPVNLYAYPVDAGMKLEAFMDFLTGAMRQWPFVKDLATEAELEVSLLGNPALVRTLTYTNSPKGGKTIMAWVAFIREPSNPKGARIGYMLGVLMSDKNSDKALPTLAAMARTIVLTEPAGPVPATLDVQSCIIEDSQFSFAIAQPWGWASKQTDKGYEIGQMDFATGAVSPKVEVMVLTIDGSYTPQTFGEEAAAKTTPTGVVRTILSKGPAKLGGLDGYQLVASQAPQPGAAASATAPGATAAPAVPSALLARLACVDRPDGKKTLYALIVRCQQGDAKTAEALADKFASTFAIRTPAQPPPPQPAPAANTK